MGNDALYLIFINDNCVVLSAYVSYVKSHITVCPLDISVEKRISIRFEAEQVVFLDNPKMQISYGCSDF